MTKSHDPCPAQQRSTDKIWTIQRLLVSVPRYLQCIGEMQPTGDVLSEYKRFEVKWQEIAKSIRHVIIWRSRGVAERVCDAAEELDKTLSFVTELNQLSFYTHELQEFQKEIIRCKRRAQDIVDDIKDICATIQDIHNDLVFSAKHGLVDRVWGILSRDTHQRHVMTKETLRKMRAAVMDLRAVLSSWVCEDIILPNTNGTVLHGGLDSDNNSDEQNDAVLRPDTDKAACNVDERTGLTKDWIEIASEIEFLNGTLDIILTHKQKTILMKRLEILSESNQGINGRAVIIRLVTSGQRNILR